MTIFVLIDTKTRNMARYDGRLCTHRANTSGFDDNIVESFRVAPPAEFAEEPTAA